MATEDQRTVYPAFFCSASNNVSKHRINTQMHESSLEVEQLDSVVAFQDMKTNWGPHSTFHRETQESPVNQEWSSQEKDIPLTHCCHYGLGQNDNYLHTIEFIAKQQQKWITVTLYIHSLHFGTQKTAKLIKLQIQYDMIGDLGCEEWQWI